MDGKRFLRGHEVEDVSPDELVAYEGNAKRHTREQLDAVEASVREFGFRNPVLAWHDADGRAVIVAGHARCEVARRLGMPTVPVLWVDDLDDARRRALTLADNQTTMMTGWDADALAAELDALSGELDMGALGFGDLTDDDFSLSDGDDADAPDGGATLTARFDNARDLGACVDQVRELVEARGGRVSVR